MRKVGSKDTRPELRFRKRLHALGYRYRLHVRSLPGTPDLVLRKYRVAIQVRGCFWHGHGCKYGRLPKSNKAFWRNKIVSNIKRDNRTDRALRAMGWSVLVVWGCRCRTEESLEAEVLRVHRYLKKRFSESPD